MRRIWWRAEDRDHAGRPDGIRPVWSGTVTPISTATRIAGAPIEAGGPSDGDRVAPDGKTAYVACLGTLRHPGTWS
jgi:hypothetical protein